jgi:hypothetical protein
LLLEKEYFWATWQSSLRREPVLLPRFGPAQMLPVGNGPVALIFNGSI